MYDNVTIKLMKAHNNGKNENCAGFANAQISGMMHILV